MTSSSRPSPGDPAGDLTPNDLAALVSGLPVGVVRWDPVLDEAGQLIDMKVGFVNAAAAVWIGLSPEAAVGHTAARVGRLGDTDATPWEFLQRIWLTGAEQRAVFTRDGLPTRHRHEVTFRRVGEYVAGVGVNNLGIRASDSREVESEQLLRRVLDASSDGFAVCRRESGTEGTDPVFRLVFMNSAGAAAFGRDAADLVGLEIGEVVPADSDVLLRDALVSVMSSGEKRTRRSQVQVGSQDGVIDSALAPLGGDLILLTWRDVTEQVRAQQVLAAAYEETAAVRATLQTALDATSDAFAVYEIVRDEAMAVAGLRLVAINLAGALPLASSPEDLLGRDLVDFYPDAVPTGLWDVVRRAIEADEVLRHRVDVHDEAGEWQAAFDNTVAPAGDNRVVITWRDASEVVRSARALAQLSDRAHHDATHDPLTGLPNRVLFLRKLQEALDGQPPGARTGLAFVDVDHFKSVNDTFGHAAGDHLLQVIGERLTTVVRRGDSVARLGGDEFVLVLRDLPGDWSSEDFFARVAESLNQPVTTESGIVTPSASLGLVYSPPAAPHIETMMREADHAMYESKRAGRARGTVAARPR